MKVYLAGLKGKGRYIFEKFVEMQKHFEDKNIEIEAVYEKDFDFLEKASNFAEINGIKFGDFKRFDSMMENVDRYERNLMVDSVSRYSFMKKAVSKDMVYLSRRPDVKRISMLSRVKEMENCEVSFLDTGSKRSDPLVERAAELLEDEEVESIRYFTENTEGVERILEDGNIPDLNGGNFWRNVPPQIACLETVLRKNIEVEEIKTEFYTPKNISSDFFLTVEGSKNGDIYQDTATGLDRVKATAGEVKIEMESSWIGISEECRKICEELENLTGHSPLKSWINREKSENIHSKEAEFLIIEGSRHLLLDLADRRIFDLDSGKNLDVPPIIHSPAYMFLETTVMEKEVSGDLETYIKLDNEKSIEAETDSFKMLDKARNKVKENIEDKVFVEEKLV